MKTVFVINTTIGLVQLNHETIYFASKSDAKNHILWFEAKEKWKKVSIQQRKVLDDVKTI